jgi:hypothetical protein
MLPYNAVTTILFFGMVWNYLRFYPHFPYNEHQTSNVSIIPRKDHGIFSEHQAQFKATLINIPAYIPKACHFLNNERIKS